MTAVPIYHIATEAEAERLRLDGRLEPESLNVEGFVHCSTALQVVATTERHFAPGAELVLIELSADAIGDDLQWPEVYPGERFPHLHRAVLATDVVALHPWRRSDRNAWRSPA